MAREGVYDPADVTVKVGTRNITGFYNGTFIEVSRNNPKEMSATAGSRGEYALSVNKDKTGQVSLVLHAESESNSYLGSLANSKSVVPLFINRNGETISEIITSPEAWIEEVPQKSYDAEEPSRTWQIGCGDLQQIDN